MFFLIVLLTIISIMESLVHIYVYNYLKNRVYYI